METNTATDAGSSRSSADVDAELEQLEQRRAQLQREKERTAVAEREPADREEAFVSGLVELVIGANQNKPVNELRKRAHKVLEALKGT